MIKNSKEDIDLMLSIADLTSLFDSSQGMQPFLAEVVKTVASHMNADVCSIYLYNRENKNLILKATAGLNLELIDKLTINKSEGLVGLSIRELRAVCEADAEKNPHFLPIEESGENRYRAFLAVPILRGLNKVGVLVVQHSKPAYFKKSDKKALMVIASHLAASIENANLILALNDTKKDNEECSLKDTGSCIIKGTPIVPGIISGRAYKMAIESSGPLKLCPSKKCYKEDLNSFLKAVEDTENQILSLEDHIGEEFSEFANMIFDAHALILKDKSFTGKMKNLIENEGVAAQNAVTQVVNQFIDIFSASEDNRMKEKVQDIKDLGHRLLENLLVESESEGDYSGQVIISRELLPSELIKLSAQNAAGFVLSGQGATAHISILAKSIGSAMIYSDDIKLDSIEDDTPLIVDAYQGTLYISPTEEIKTRIKPHLISDNDIEKTDLEVSDKTLTKDGQIITLGATINLLNDLKRAIVMKQDGIGLYRSEFPFIIRNNFPSEEEQYQVYRKVVTAMPAKDVVLRTLDIGGDKILSYMPDSQEDNPFLGLRAIRFLLKNKKIFVEQLKAMLRAGKDRDIKIMFPLVGSLDDFRAAKRLVEKSIGFLKRDELKHNNKPELGLMIELPSAVLLADELCKEADFVSIGSNDLIQYLLGVDRTNSSVASLYQGEHPAVLKAIAEVAKAAQKNDCKLSICGNLSYDKRLLYFFIGLGIESFSITPERMPEIQQFISTVNFEDAKKDSVDILKLRTIKDVREYFNKKLPDTVINS